MTKSREIAHKLFKTSGIEDTPYNWHIWKRAFDLGWASNTIKSEKQ